MTDAPKAKPQDQGKDELKLPSKLLIIEDEPVGLDDLRRGLEKFGVMVKIAPDLPSLSYFLNNESYEVGLISMELRNGGGLLAAQKIRSLADPARAAMGLIMMSSGRMRSKEESNLGTEIGDIEYVQKPIRAPLLIAYLARALARKERTIVFDKVREKVINYKDFFGGFEQALEQVKPLVGKFGARGPVLLLELYENAGKVDEAHDIVKSLVTAHPDNIQFVNMMGSSLLKMGRVAEAREYMEKADRLAPSKIERIEKMVDMYLELGEPDKSIEKMGSLIELNPEKPDVKLEMLDKLCDKDYHDHAQRLCEDKVKPAEVVKYYNNKGVMLSKEGKAEDAVENYNRALKFYPNFKENFRVHFNNAMALYNNKTLGSWNKALKELDSCLALQPDFEKAVKLRELIKEKLTQMKGKPSGTKSA